MMNETQGPSRNAKTLSQLDLVTLMKLSFDKMPAHALGTAFGVPYIRLDEPNGGQLFITKYGWTMIEHLLPKAWYSERYFSRRGKLLPKATGAVYRVEAEARGRVRSLVVKFSRLAQDVPLFLAADFKKKMPDQIVYDAHFNSPFEEFGLVMQLREYDPSDPNDIRIRTKRPLAIYSPSIRPPLWKLGRHRREFLVHQRSLNENQVQDDVHAFFELDLAREYITIHEWVDGEDAEDMYDKGVLSEVEMFNLSDRVNEELAYKGFRVLDTKPRHFILRQRKDGSLMMRNGQLVYVLIDFELLQRISERC